MAAAAIMSIPQTRRVEQQEYIFTVQEIEESWLSLF
jgi:hypothetical protein